MKVTARAGLTRELQGRFPHPNYFAEHNKLIGSSNQARLSVTMKDKGWVFLRMLSKLRRIT